MTKLGILHDDRYQRHETGPRHPERPARLEAIGKGLDRSGVMAQALRIEPRPAEHEQLETRHHSGYIERFRKACEMNQRYIDTPDSAIGPDSYEIALLAAGGTIEAARLIGRGEIQRAFCAVRPPGHHAEQSRSMGFCMFNNTVLAADVFRNEFGLERVLILDWDVHHGNGTQNAFYSDPAVLFISLHGHPKVLYPGTGFAEERGQGAGREATLNISFMPNAGDEDYRREFESRVEPAVRSFEPQAIIISAGFDAHQADPLGIMRLSNEMFGEMLRQILEWALQYSEGRVLSVLEGGYNLEVLEACTADHVRLLAQ